MKKTLLILSFILLSVVSFAQRQRTTAMFDSDTTTRPKTGFYGIGVRANNIYFVPTTGNNIRLANYSLFTGLTTNYLSKWNGSKLVNSGVFESGDKVGIGTASPTNKLHVLSSSGTAAMIESSTSQTFYGLKSNTGGVVYFGNTNGGDYTIQTSGSGYSDKLYITSAGNVGIGTSSPSVKLEVTGNIGLSPNSGSSRYLFIPTATDTYTGQLHIQSGAGSDGYGGAITMYGHSHATKPGWVTAGISVGSGTVGTSNEGRFTVNSSALGGGTDLFTVLRSGNVGIGTTTPTSKLQVVGLPTYADNAAAITGGLTTGAFYRTSVGVLMVVY